MMKLFAPLLIAATLFAQAPANRRNFVACPIVRDTKTTPCWLAEYKGETYFLGVQGGVAQDFYPPQLSHEVLVEGTVVEGPRVCGGIPLRPVKLSVFQEINASCTTMLPAEDGIEAPATTRLTGPAPSWLKLDGPAASTLYFDFDNDFLSVHTVGALTNATKYFKQSNASRIEVTGSRGATLLSSGEVLTEKAGLGQIRARKVADMLIGLGVPAGAIVVNASEAAVKPDGVNDPWNRRVVITVKP
jgi:hypothetical protein